MPFPPSPDDFDACDEGQDCSCYEDEHDWQDYEDDPSLCCLGDACLNPHPYHTADECFDLEMAQAAEEETRFNESREARGIAARCSRKVRP